MRRVHRSWLPLLPLLLAGLLALTAGCVTKRAVEEIVGRTNAAMVSPYLDRADGDQPGGADKALAEIDRLIQAYPDNAVLVAHLRVRQAMVLTVQKHSALAEERWKQVSEGELKSERDKALYTSREVLVWAYRRLPVRAPLDANEKAEAKKHFLTLDEALEPVETPDISIYLNTIRAQIALKLANSMDEENEKAEIEKLLAKSLDKYAAALRRKTVVGRRRTSTRRVPPPRCPSSSFGSASGCATSPRPTSTRRKNSIRHRYGALRSRRCSLPIPKAKRADWGFLRLENLMAADAHASRDDRDLLKELVLGRHRMARVVRSFRPVKAIQLVSRQLRGR